MIEKATYELTITEKLEQLTVPDMIDAIWARIETRLDIDMPPDEGPTEPPSHPPAGTGPWIGAGIAIAVTAFLAIFYFTNKKPNTAGGLPANEQAVPTIVSPLPTRTFQSPTPPGNKGVSPPYQPATAAIDSMPADGMAATPPAKPDSTVNMGGLSGNPPFTPPLVVSVPDTTKKPGRGVKGISDDDYRIVPAKKDSTN